MDTTIERTNGGFLVGKIKQIQGRVFEKLLTDHGISEFNGAQGRILFVLWDQDDIPIRELADKTGLAKTTLTSMLDRLERSGHILRIADPKDRRSMRIRLTEQARGLREQYDAVSAEMSELFYQGFSDEEILKFEKNLRMILDNLTKKERDYGQKGMGVDPPSEGK